MRYEGSVQVMGFIRVVVEGPRLTEAEARKLVQSNPKKYQVGGDVDSIIFESWEDFEKTEDDDE